MRCSKVSPLNQSEWSYSVNIWVQLSPSTSWFTSVHLLIADLFQRSEWKPLDPQGRSRWVGSCNSGLKQTPLTFVYAHKGNVRHPNIIQHERTDSAEAQPFQWLMMMTMAMMMMAELPTFSLEIRLCLLIELNLPVHEQPPRDGWAVEIAQITYLNLVNG